VRVVYAADAVLPRPRHRCVEPESEGSESERVGGGERKRARAREREIAGARVWGGGAVKEFEKVAG